MLPKVSRPLLSWALYDFANTIFSAVVLTAFFPLYFTKITGSNSALLFARQEIEALCSTAQKPLPTGQAGMQEAEQNSDGAVSSAA